MNSNESDADNTDAVVVVMLPVLKAREDHMAIVVDEFGSAIGIITMEDIIEEVVGDIDVEYEFEEYVTRKHR